MIARLFILLMGTAFFCVGGFIAYFTVVSGGWPTTSAHVISGEVHETDDHDNEGNATTNYTAQIKYKYQVDSKDYIGTTVSYDDYGSSDRSHAQNILNAYPVGTDITIHYNPKTPDQAVIRGGSVGVFPAIFMIIGALMVIGAILAQSWAVIYYLMFGSF